MGIPHLTVSHYHTLKLLYAVYKPQDITYYGTEIKPEAPTAHVIAPPELSKRQRAWLPPARQNVTSHQNCEVFSNAYPGKAQYTVYQFVTTFCDA
jgi:hypothetical protein